MFLLLFLAVLAYLLRRCSTRRHRAEGPGEEARCTLRNCLRCKKEDTLRAEASKKLMKLPADAHPRVLAVLNSCEFKTGILCQLYEESGRSVPSSEELRHQPHVWSMPGLHRRPWWGPDSPDVLGATGASELRARHQSILEECRNVMDSEDGWARNAVPSGQWRLFYLYNQGMKYHENCKKCPRTVELIEDFPSFMQTCPFGNAMFSVLEPGSTIPPHTGACNFRIRCHLSLVAPRGYVLHVGTGRRSWEEGKVLCFDDSYVHSVGDEGVSSQERVVLIFDLWHPEVTTEERRVLSEIFSD